MRSGAPRAGRCSPAETVSPRTILPTVHSGRGNDLNQFAPRGHAGSNRFLNQDAGASSGHFADSIDVLLGWYGDDREVEWT